jgi:hypothetical protein
MDLQALKTELDAGHPVTGAYNADAALAVDELNAVNSPVNLSTLTGDEVFNAADSTEYSALTNDDKQLFLSICGRDSIDPFGTNNVAAMQSIFGGGSATMAALATLRVTTQSRASILGLGRVLANHVLEARAL